MKTLRHVVVGVFAALPGALAGAVLARTRVDGFDVEMGVERL